MLTRWHSRAESLTCAYWKSSDIIWIFHCKTCGYHQQNDRIWSTESSSIFVFVLTEKFNFFFSKLKVRYHSFSVMVHTKWFRLLVPFQGASQSFKLWSIHFAYEFKTWSRATFGFTLKKNLHYNHNLWFIRGSNNLTSDLTLQNWNPQNHLNCSSEDASSTCYLMLEIVWWKKLFNWYFNSNVKIGKSLTFAFFELFSDFLVGLLSQCRTFGQTLVESFR